jgi:hypothetical protein
LSRFGAAADGRYSHGPGARSAGGLVAAGKRFEDVIPARAGADVEYDVKGLYTEFLARAAVDDGFAGTVRVAVVGDGRELWTSDPLGRSGLPTSVRVNIAGVQKLVLRSTEVRGGEPSDQEKGPGMRQGAQAGWIDARLSGPAVMR